MTIWLFGKTKTDVEKELKQLVRNTMKIETLNDQMRNHVHHFGWDGFVFLGVDEVRSTLGKHCRIIC